MADLLRDNLYCSLDLEMSGFDPAADEILEIGFVFFRLTHEGIEVVEEWTKVFRPTAPVHPKILGLTGITTTELENAPQISEYKDFLQDKLGSAIIVGHSVKVDIAFLEAAGIVFSGGSVDTLELAQFILPTQHSYNLENLIHTFGIVTTVSHRALADAQATMYLLEKLLRIYQGFPSVVHHQVHEVINSFEVIWKDLLLLTLPPVILSQPSLDSALPPVDEELARSLQPNTIVTQPITGFTPQQILSSLVFTAKSWVWVVSDKDLVVKLWRAGLVEPVFGAEDYFDERKFQEFLDTPEMSLEQARFALKIIIWQHTNWQTKSIIDLNISFFGGQFRSAIAAEEIPVIGNAAVVMCEYNTFLKLGSPFFHGRSVLLEHLHEFERALSRNVARRASWGFLQYGLKTIYNPETEFGDISRTPQVIDLLARADLFFGLVRLSFDPHGRQQFITEDALSNNDFEYQRIQLAAEHLITAVSELKNQLQHELLNEFIRNLEHFFAADPAVYVRWVEIREGYCAFVTQPLEISPLAEQLYRDFSGNVTFLQTLSSQPVERFNVKRVAASDFARAERSFEPASEQIPVTFSSESIEGQSLLKAISENDLPVVVALPNLEAVKEFYRLHFNEMNELGVVYAQGYSGGSNKIVRNFGLRQNSILLVTHEFLASVAHGAVKPATLIVTGLEEVQSSHPYAEALQKRYGLELGEAYPVIRSMQIFEQLIIRLNLSALKQVYCSSSDVSLVSYANFIEATGQFNLHKS